mgnify:CR=1 FL=1
MNKPQTQEESHIGIVQLYYKIEDVQGELSQVKQVLNNGIVKATAENTEAVCNLRDEFEETKKNIAKKEGYYSGSKKTIKIIGTAVGSALASAVSVLTILEMMNKISIIGG